MIFENSEELKRNMPYVVTYTHASAMDGYIIFKLQDILGRYKSPVKNTLFKIPVFGRMLIASNYVPIKRDNHAIAVKSLNDLGA